jgi:V-type H+-transporting ATPase subunit a
LIVDTYGIPTYKEANPALFACISFPFFFGVMFGDIMHGSLLFIFSIWLCFAKAEPGSLAGTLAPVKYLFLLMGFFATYCGLIYNDFTSMSTQIFGASCYTSENLKPNVVKGIEEGYVFAKINEEYSTSRTELDCVYPFGFDPVWFRSAQEISFMNSFKMKTSVIFGVAQMSLGTVVKGFNAVYFKRWTELIFEVMT